MAQKILKVGSSAAVTIPKRAMEKLGLRVGDRVSVDVDTKTTGVLIRPEAKVKKNDRIAALTLDFIDRYRNDLLELAKR